MDYKLLLQSMSNMISLTDEEKDIITMISAEYAPWRKSLSSREKHAIRKYSYNSHDRRKPNRFFERLNRALREPELYHGTDKRMLLRYGETISKAISRHPLEHEITCYRGVDEDIVSGLNEGAKFQFRQFISTSVIESAALRAQYEYVILLPKDSCGAYIEEISAFKGQFEFLLDKSCLYRLKTKKENIVYLEVVV